MVSNISINGATSTVSIVGAVYLGILDDRDGGMLWGLSGSEGPSGFLAGAYPGTSDGWRAIVSPLGADEDEGPVIGKSYTLTFDLGLFLAFLEDASVILGAVF